MSSDNSGSKKKKKQATLTPALLFDTFLFESEKEKNALLRFVAQYMCGNIPEQPIFLVGPSGTGKTVLGNLFKLLFDSCSTLAVADRDGNASPIKIVLDNRRMANMVKFLLAHPDHVMKFKPLLIGNLAPPADTPGMDKVTVVRMKPLASERIVDPHLEDRIVEDELTGVLERCMLASAAE